MHTLEWYDSMLSGADEIRSLTNVDREEFIYMLEMLEATIKKDKKSALWFWDNEFEGHPDTRRKMYSRAQKSCGFNAYIYRQKSPKTTPKL